MSTVEEFTASLARAVNYHSRENASNTPDWILADFMAACLAALNAAVQQRETWYGRDGRPSAPDGSQPVEPTPAPAAPAPTPPVFQWDKCPSCGGGIGCLACKKIVRHDEIVRSGEATPTPEPPRFAQGVDNETFLNVTRELTERAEKAEADLESARAGATARCTELAAQVREAEAERATARADLVRIKSGMAVMGHQCDYVSDTGQATGYVRCAGAPGHSGEHGPHDRVRGMDREPWVRMEDWLRERLQQAITAKRTAEADARSAREALVASGRALDARMDDAQKVVNAAELRAAAAREEADRLRADLAHEKRQSNLLIDQLHDAQVKHEAEAERLKRRVHAWSLRSGKVATALDLDAHDFTYAEVAAAVERLKARVAAAEKRAQAAETRAEVAEGAHWAASQRATEARDAALEKAARLAISHRWGTAPAAEPGEVIARDILALKSKQGPGETTPGRKTEVVSQPIPNSTTNSEFNNQASETTAHGCHGCNDTSLPCPLHGGETREPAPPVDPLDMLHRGGEWLGAARDRIKWWGGNGDRVTWGSNEEIRPPLTVDYVERIAAYAAAAAINEDRKQREPSGPSTPPSPEKTEAAPVAESGPVAHDTHGADGERTVAQDPNRCTECEEHEMQAGPSVEELLAEACDPDGLNLYVEIARDGGPAPSWWAYARDWNAWSGERALSHRQYQGPTLSAVLTSLLESERKEKP